MACTGCEKAAHGIAGVAKAAMGIDRAGEDTIQKRRDTCRKCDRAVPCVGNMGRKCKCSECGCFLKPKTALASETCPIGKW